MGEQFAVSRARGPMFAAWLGGGDAGLFKNGFDVGGSSVGEKASEAGAEAQAQDVLWRCTEDLFSDARHIIDEAQKAAYRAVNVVLVQRNWLLGRRIAEEELRGEGRAEYGAQAIRELSKRLTKEYGKGFAKSNLYQFVQFYREFPDIFHSVSGKCPLLSWTHYRVLLQVPDKAARDWYAREAAEQTWSVRTLQRNIGSQYYYRMLSSQHPDAVRREMERITEPYQSDKLEFIKNPVVAEFLGLSPNSDHTETELEAAIITNLQKFLMELGKGYAFVARQKHIHTDKEDYYIDLVFYNYILKCFVLIDLKTSKVRHQDVGQMDMYVRMYDERERGEDDNPTLGLVLCAETDEDIARYSVLHDNDRLFASKYEPYLPTQEQLKAEIEAQKALFELQRAEKARA